MRQEIDRDRPRAREPRSRRQGRVRRLKAFLRVVPSARELAVVLIVMNLSVGGTGVLLGLVIAEGGNGGLCAKPGEAALSRPGPPRTAPLPTSQPGSASTQGGGEP